MTTNPIQLSPLQRFFNMLKVDRQDIFGIYVYAIFTGILNLSLPLGIQAIINLITGGEVSTSWILLVIFVIAGIALVGVMQVMQLTISENLRQKIFTRSAFEFAYRIPRMKQEAVDKLYVPELVNRFFDTLSIQKGLSKILIDVSSASLQIVFGLILLSVYNPFFIIFSLLLVIVIYLIFRFAAPVGMKTSLKESKYKYEVAHWLEELGRSMKIFKLAGHTNLPMTRTDKAVAGYLGSRKAHFRVLVFQYINLIAFKVLVAAGLLIIGSLLVMDGELNIGQFVAAEIIIILVLASVEKLILSMETVYDVLTAIEKLATVTDIPLEEDHESYNPPVGSGLSINLKNLSFGFPVTNKKLLDDINIQVNSGEFICLSGFHGSGKSLLLQVIAGLYVNYEGSISFEDTPLDNWNKAELRSLTGDNLAQADIFSGTLFENMCMGRTDIQMEDIREITRVIGLTSYIESLPEGYRTRLITEGMDLARNIRLKIKLARALAGNPKLILLDDTFRDLPLEDKNRFLEFVLNKEKGWTVVAISNDREIARLFNRVIVLEKGKVMADAPIDELKNEVWFDQVFHQ